MSYATTLGKPHKLARASKKEVVVDGRGHLLGRLASVVAKHLLNGYHVTVVRCEEINQTGSRKLRCLTLFIDETVTVAVDGNAFDRHSILAFFAFFKNLNLNLIPPTLRLAHHRCPC